MTDGTDPIASTEARSDTALHQARTSSRDAGIAPAEADWCRIWPRSRLARRPL